MPTMGQPMMLVREAKTSAVASYFLVYGSLCIESIPNAHKLPIHVNSHRASAPNLVYCANKDCTNAFDSPS